MTTLYGVAYGTDGLNNVEVGRSAGRVVVYRYRATHTGVLNSVAAYVKCDGAASPTGYWNGTGGSIKLELQSDNGSGFPSGTVLATKTLVTPGGTSSVTTWTFTSAPSVVAGTVYHMVWTNTDGAPTTNFVSLNCLDQSNGVTNGGTSPLQPAMPDADQAVLRTFQTGDPQLINLDRYPIFKWTFADATVEGQAYYDAPAQSAPATGHAFIGNQSAVRLNFTPTSARTISKVWVRLYKQSGTTHDLTLRFKQGSTLLDTLTIPVASINQGNTGSGYGARWVSATLTTPISVVIGTQYSLEMWSPSETTSPFVSHPIQGGGGAAFGTALGSPNVFTDGYYEETTNNGTLWSQYSASSAYKAQVYFEQPAAPPFTPGFTPKAWMDFSTGGTPLTAAALIDVETRLSSYTDAATGGNSVTSAVFNVQNYGARGTDTTDDTTAIQAAVTAASVAGGVVFFPPGTYYISGAITIPVYVSVLGAGKYVTYISCTAAAAGLKFGAQDNPGTFGFGIRGGRSGDFNLLGNSLATNPLYIGYSVQRTFQDIRVTDALQDGVVLEQSQNNLFLGCDFETNGRYGLRLDWGAGGNAFYRCEINQNIVANLRITQSGDNTGGAAGYLYPTDNGFDRCLFERATNSSFVASIDMDSGWNTVFTDCVFMGGGATLDRPCVRFRDNASTTSWNAFRTSFDSCWFYGQPTTPPLCYGIDISTTVQCDVYLSGLTLFESLKNAFYLNDNAVVHTNGDLRFVNVTNRYLTNGGTAAAQSLIYELPYYPAYHQRTSATDIVYQISQEGVGDWFKQNAAGTMYWGPGTSSVDWDTYLYRNAAGQLATDGSFKVGNLLATGATITAGTGSPNSVVTGSPGDVFLRTDGSATTVIYVKGSGSATNTGWINMVTAPIAESDVTGLVADLALKAPLASPTLTGTPLVGVNPVLNLPADGYNSVWGPHISDDFALAATANLLYYCAVSIPIACSITGIQVVNGSTVAGNVRVALYPVGGGSLLASSASTARAGGTFTQQLVPFTSPYSAVPGTYFMAAMYSTTDTFLAHGPLVAAATAAQGAFTPPATITPPATTARNFVPQMSTY